MNFFIKALNKKDSEMFSRRISLAVYMSLGKTYSKPVSQIIDSHA